MKTKSRTSGYIEVAPAVPLQSPDRQTFTYHASPTTLARSIVRIPFGRFAVNGVVVKTDVAKPSYPTKEVIPLQDTVTLTEQQLSVARWIADVMHGGLGYTLRLFLPPGLSGKSPIPKKDTATVSQQPILSPTLHTIASKAHAKLSPKKPTVIIESQLAKRQQAITELAAAIAAEGKQVAIIVPEIALIDPLVDLLNELIPEDSVVGLHSSQGPAHTKKVWHGVADGTLRIVVGTQKILCLPWKELGLLVVEQAYYPTHKLWDQYPRLPTIQSAPAIAAIYKAPLLYASALPSLYLYHHVQEKKYSLAHDHTAAISVTDLPYHPADREAKHLLPTELLQKLKKWNRQKKRVFILYNKKGAWQVVLCRACRRTVTCPTCNIALTVHSAGISAAGKKAYTLQCKQCGKKQPKPAVCPSCHKGSLQFVRPGIETMVQVIKSLHIKPLLIEAAAASDVTPAQVAKATVIIGTQAAFRFIAPESLDRVVWLYPEDSLQFPDARSREKSRYLLSRLSELPIKKHIYVATRQPRQTLEELHLSTKAIWEAELKVRKRLFYPPFQDMVRLTAAAKTEEKASSRAETIREDIEKHITDKKLPVRILGPFTAFTHTRRGQSESHVLLLGNLADITPLYQDVVCDMADYMPERIL